MSSLRSSKEHLQYHTKSRESNRNLEEGGAAQGITHTAHDAGEEAIGALEVEGAV
jgi:hypothetical protein